MAALDGGAPSARGFPRHRVSSARPPFRVRPPRGSPMSPLLTSEGSFPRMAAARPAAAREVGRKGVHLQIDDPILSQGMRDFGPALRRLDAIAGEVPRDRVSVPVCGSLARGEALEGLLRLQNG